MQKSLSLKWKTKKRNVIKALNRANWNGRKVSVEIAGEEGKDAPKGKRRNEGGNYGKKEFDGKKRSYKDERRSEVAGNAAIRPNMPLPTRKRTSPVAKNAVIPRHAAKKTIGNSSFKAITNLKIQNRTSAKKAGQNGHLKRNKQTT